MITEKFDGSIERQILAGMVMSKAVISRISGVWQDGMLFGKASNLLAGWAVEHFRKYGKPIRQGVRTRYEEWAGQVHDDETAKSLESFIAYVSDEYSSNGKVSSAYLADVAGKHLNETRIRRLRDALTADLDSGQIDKSEARITKHSRIELGAGAGVHLFQNEEAVRSTFEREIREQVVEYKDGLGLHFQNELEREGFVAFAGPQKSGKTFWLIDIAWRAMLQRKRVAFFEIGDLTERQVKERFLVRAAEHPLRSRDGKWPCVVRYPVGMSNDSQDEVAMIRFEDRVYKQPLNADRAWAACERVMQTGVRSKRSYFQFSCHANLSIGILGIRSIIDSWILNGWVPDVCVIDYADNLAPVDKREEVRDRVNTTWKLMRALPYDLHCLLVTGTQVNAAGFTKKWLDRTSFSEDNRKLSHVTGISGVNVTSEEKEQESCRLNWMVKREGEYSVRRGAHVAGCLALANPAVLSIYPTKTFSENS